MNTEAKCAHHRTEWKRTSPHTLDGKWCSECGSHFTGLALSMLLERDNMRAGSERAKERIDDALDRAEKAERALAEASEKAKELLERWNAVAGLDGWTFPQLVLLKDIADHLAALAALAARAQEKG